MTASDTYGGGAILLEVVGGQVHRTQARELPDDVREAAAKFVARLREVAVAAPVTDDPTLGAGGEVHLRTALEIRAEAVTAADRLVTAPTGPLDEIVTCPVVRPGPPPGGAEGDIVIVLPRRG